MAFQRAPLPEEPEDRPVEVDRRAHLRLVHSSDTVLTDAAARGVEDPRAPARGVVIGVLLALVAFWAPLAVLASRLLAR